MPALSETPTWFIWDNRSKRTIDPDGTHMDSATSYVYATSTDNLIETIQYGQVTGNSNGTFTDTGTDERIASTTYAASTSVNMYVPIEQSVS